jgi:predicted alpha/beta-hydrolase family hydrolase
VSISHSDKLSPREKIWRFLGDVVRSTAREMAKTVEIEVVCAGKKPGETVTLPGAVTSPSDGRASDTGVILLHGAGGDLHGGHMNTTAAYFADHLGTPVFRVTMKSPDVNYRLRAAHGLISVALSHGVSRFILAGQSNGARVCCNLFAQLVDPENHDAFPKAKPSAELVQRFDKTKTRQQTTIENGSPARVSSLVLFSYPLHAPGKTSERDLRRDELERAFDAAPKARDHLRQMVPIKFIRGERDAFANATLFDACVKRFIKKVNERLPLESHPDCKGAVFSPQYCTDDVVYVMPGGDHGLSVQKSAAVGTDEAREKALAFVCRSFPTSEGAAPPPPKGKGKRAREEEEEAVDHN